MYWNAAWEESSSLGTVHVGREDANHYYSLRSCT